MAHYESNWWSFKLPAGWSGREEEDCHTFESDCCVGALQVSAYRKEAESMSDDELREFAGDIPLRAVTLGTFTGFRKRYSDGDVFWIKWWLRAGATMIYATYNSALEERDEDEEAMIERALDSLTAL